MNRDVPVENPPPGVVIYRFEESFLFPNASYINDKIVGYVKEHTRRGKDQSLISKGDRPWNDPGPSKANAAALLEAEKSKPLLKAVILDFSAVANLDTTGVQNLVDTRREVEKWADKPVQFHFAGILSPWIRRALIAAGFGVGHLRHGNALEIAPVVPQDNSLSPQDQARQDEERLQTGSRGPSPESSIADKLESDYNPQTLEAGDHYNGRNTRDSNESDRTVPLLDRATPFFHFDLADAINSLDLSEEQK